LKHLRINEPFLRPKHFHTYFSSLWMLFLIKFLQIKTTRTKTLSFLLTFC
jgi:hypothetical protein